MGILTALFDNKTYNFEQAFGVQDITTKEMKAAINDWYGLYYQREADKEEDPCQRLPVSIVSKLTKTAFSEYSATPAKDAGNEYVVQILAALDSARKKAVQQALIGGLCFLKPIFFSTPLHFTVISRDNMLILARDDTGAVTSVGTAERTVEGKYYYTLLERRTVDPYGHLTIQSKLYRSQMESVLGTEVMLGTLPKYAALSPELLLPGVGSLGLVPVRTPLENCVDGSQDAVSVFAPAVGLIHNINRNEAQINQEFENGKSRIFVDETVTRDCDGRKALTDSVFVGAPGDYSQGGGIAIFSPAFREQSFLARKTEYLRNVESLIGLKRGILSEVEAAERTATEVTSSAGDYNLSIIEFQEMWENAVREAVRVCEVLGRLYKAYSGPAIDPEKDVVIDWGNGILFDEDKTWADYMAMVAAGMIRPEIALAWKFNLPWETPEDLAKIRDKYMPELESMVDGGDGEE